MQLPTLLLAEDFQRGGSQRKKAPQQETTAAKHNKLLYFFEGLDHVDTITQERTWQFGHLQYPPWISRSPGPGYEVFVHERCRLPSPYTVRDFGRHPSQSYRD